MLINQRSALTNEWSGPAGWNDHAVLVRGGSVQFSNSVPKVVQNLRPIAITIAPDYVQVYVAAPPPTLLLGFPDGAKEWGTTKLIDGLWHWDGRTPNESP
jgi:hypothetical protein